jgi:hypothetical protein
MLTVILFWIVLAVVLIGGPLPSALREKSWLRFFISLVVTAVGILFPLFIFGASLFLVPEWKGGCHHGWLDCFHLGKLALTPLVLWASAAFYCVLVLRVQNPRRTWITLGLFAGAIVSTLCLVFGLVVHLFQDDFWLWLGVPLYVAACYVVLGIRAIRGSKLNVGPYLVTLAGTAPLWALSLFLSKRHYLALPDNPPSCFVVTAALRGHEGIVGPFINVGSYETARIANRQLSTFWAFEAMWLESRPNAHRRFRAVYNRIGPPLASRIRTPLQADMVYLLLTPLEAIARVMLRLGWSDACRQAAHETRFQAQRERE